jgi:hypothetical protein
MSVRSYLGKVLAIAALGLVASCACQAQLATGTILGRITDPSGAVVQGATVVVINSETGVAVTIRTNPEGNYVVPFLRSGVYRVKAQAAGFKNIEHGNLQLRMDDRLEVNLTLELGSTSESVTVTSATPLLETASASSGLVVDTRRITDLPTTQGVAFTLMEMAPGANYGSPSYMNEEQPFAGRFMSYAINGTQAQQSEMTMDGTAGRIWNSIVPPADTIAEFKVLTTPFDASVGNTAGGSVDITMKSGTNTPHGTAYYVKGAPVLTANTFFGNRNGLPRADFGFSRWGGSAGGPVMLPKLYKGRNRTFFFAGYEGVHQSPVNGTTLTVPTAKERGGDFSALLALGAQYQIYDPMTRRAIAGGRFQQDPLPGNVISPSRISPIAQKLLSYYALPLTQGTVDGISNYPLPNAPELDTYYVLIGRVDHNFSDRHRIFIRGNETNRHSTYSNWFDNAATGMWYRSLDRGGALDDVYTFSSSFTMNFRYGYDRWVTNDDNNPASYNFDH